MEKCPQCGEMTAQANLYTGQIVCYHRRCGYEEKLDILIIKEALEILYRVILKNESEKKGEKGKNGKRGKTK
jgi:hypothetical protein